MLSNQSSDVLAYLFSFLNQHSIIKLRNVSKLFLNIVRNKYYVPVHFTIKSLEQGLQLISMFKKVTFTIKDDIRFDDNSLQKLAKNITILNIWNSSTITDEGIRYLVNLTRLSISYNSNITDEGLSPLVNLTGLYLNWNSKITDKGFQPLVNLTNLYLYDVDRITYKCIQQLWSKGINVFIR